MGWFWHNPCFVKVLPIGLPLSAPLMLNGSMTRWQMALRRVLEISGKKSRKPQDGPYGSPGIY
jgi:hypothetical protein